MDLSETSLFAPASISLGLSGYPFADLHDPERLASLYERFCEEVQADAPAFWTQWDDYRSRPDEPRTPLDHSRLLIEMAGFVSRFLTRLFDISEATGQIKTATRADDDL